MQSSAKLLLFVALAGCSSTHSHEGEPSGETYAPIPVPGSRCNAVLQQHALEPATHVATCSPIEYRANPPASGSHYGDWAAYGDYTVALPRGYWVHNLEHGSVVFVFDCETGCGDQIIEAVNLISTLSVDAFCLSQRLTEPRALLTPDPLLDTTWAASAWGFTLRADCFEPEVFREFYVAHVGRGPENICSAGTDFRDGSLPANCGE